MSLRLTLRSGSLAQWATAEAAGNGRLRKGEIGVGWIEVGGSITEVVMRIGPHPTPTAFSACPVISRSPLTATGANIRIPVLDTTGKTNSLLTLSGGQFVAVDDDPGSYAVSSGTDDGTGGVIPSDTPPAITLLEIVTGTPAVGVGDVLNVTHAQNVSATLRVQVAGTPAPTVTATVQTTTGTTTLTGTFASGTWTFPLPINAPASGIHIVTVTATSTVSPAATQSRSINVVRAAAPPANSIAIAGLQIKNDATNAVVTTAANASGITLRADVTTTPAATSTAYQWRRGTTDISGATNQTYLLATADDDQIVSCVVTVARNDGSTTVTASATASVNVGSVESGWTPVAPAQDSRLIYVAPDGNDSTAATAKGRGFYLPSDPEIGPDPTNPVGPIVAYATHFEAAKRLRLSNSTGTAANGFPLYGNNNPQPSTVTGFPDWILLKRGGSYTTNPTLANPLSGVMESYNLGALLGGMQQPTIGWNQATNSLSYWPGPWRGRSASEPSVVTAWGPLTDPRPIVNGFTFGGGTRHVVVSSLDLNGTDFSWGWSSDGFRAGPALIEDVRARQWGGNNTSKWTGGLTIRRCVASGNFNPGAHNQGFFVGRNDPSAGDNHRIVIEECVVDRNGYKEDPNQPQTWTSRVVSSGTAGDLPAGTGVQPTRTYFDRNLYLSSYDAMTVRGSIISRGGGASAVQMRQGGVAERNLFIWNAQSLGLMHGQTFTAEVKSSIARQNLVLHDDCFLPPGGWGTGIGAGGGNDDLAVIDDNIVAHFHRGSNGGESLGLSGKPAYGSDPAYAASPLMRGVVKDNAVFQQNGVGGIVVERSTSATYPYVVLDADVTANEVSATRLLAGQGDGTKPAAYSWSGNKYQSTSATNLFATSWTGQDYRFGTVYTNLAGWKAAGFDADMAAVETDFATFKTAAGWTAPERDIVSYMQSVDPTYVVNEDVYVDDDSTGPKQATRQKVWQVLATSVSGLYAGMPEAQAKLAARRYHAFITFIQRAKANRKGAWDPRWTADAVNNYIRQGFGKPTVSGPYTATIEDIGGQYP